MDPSVRKCVASLSAGLSEIRNFDHTLAVGDIDAAADRLTDLWNKLYEPTQILTHLYDGEFWRDWPGRHAFEANLRQVYELLNGEENDQTIAKLEEVRDYLYANFSLLKESINYLCADIGTHNLKHPMLEELT